MCGGMRQCGSGGCGRGGKTGAVRCGRTGSKTKHRKGAAVTTTATTTVEIELPRLNDIPSLTDDALAFYAYLGKGRENAQKAREIAQAPPNGLGFSRRYQQDLIDLLLLHGYFVCSSCSNTDGGYYIPTGAEDVAPFTEQLDGRIRAEALKLECYYRRFPSLRPIKLRKPPHRTRPTGETVDATLPFDSAAKRN